MIIDFHTHIWPDSLAPRAVTALTQRVEDSYKPVSDGTAAGLFSRMNEWGIDLSVVQPVVTKAAQFQTVNTFAAAINRGENAPWQGRIISFGGLWPHTDDYKRDIDAIASLGLKGIKLHPEYQGFSVDEAKYIPMYEYALEKNLILLFHAGADPAYSAQCHGTPEQFAHIADALSGHTSGAIVLAHLGGHLQWQAVEKHLAGKDVYLDTSMGFGFYSHEMFMRIYEKHGSRKILFATDSPWSCAQKELEAIRSLNIPEKAKSDILGNNAARLLHL